MASPNYPSNYGNDESCEILAPEEPLYFTDFGTDYGDELIFRGDSLRGPHFRPPQGTTTSEVILWSSNSGGTERGWQLCAVDGSKNFARLSKKSFEVFFPHRC